MRTKPVLFTTIVLAFLLAAGNAAAQGFPGGGGGGGPGRGGMGGGHGMRPHEDTPTSPKPGQSAPNPLVVFLGRVRPLRMELLVRTEQVDAWTSMQDALVAVAEAERDASAPKPQSSDPSVRLRTFADDLGRRADATKTASDRIAAVLAVLDDHQKQVFLARLSDAFGGGDASQ